MSTEVKQGISRGDKKERSLHGGAKLYIPAILQGMMFSFGHIFRKKVTKMYPEEKIVLGPEFRGRPVLVAENGTERCVACGLCARACPPLAISMQASETEDQKERFPEKFEIDMLRCIYCGFCEDVCPEEAIVMSPEYDYNFTDRKDAIMGKDRLLKSKEELKPRLDFLAKKRDNNFGENQYTFDPKNNIHTLRNREDS